MKKLGKKVVETKETIQAYCVPGDCSWCSRVSSGLSSQVSSGYNR